MEQNYSHENTDKLSSEMMANALSNHQSNTNQPWPTGYTLAQGKYIINRKLGEGGFGITYLAKTPKEELVVIKTLNEQGIKLEYLNKCREDFYQEALNLARCDHHPNVVSIKTVIPDERFPCLVMEYIPGLTLEKLVQTKGVLSEVEAIAYIRQIGNALSSIHQRNYLHRDVKPQNIIIHQDKKEAILIDFGIARNFDPNQTHQHTAFVSKGYTPLEQIYAHDKDNPPGFYTDVYGLAATLYYILTQTRPLDSQERIYSLSQGDKDPLPSPKSLNSAISEETNTAILKGLEIYHQYRPKTIEDWLALLPASVTTATATPPPTTRIPTETEIQTQIPPDLTSQKPKSFKGLMVAVIGLSSFILGVGIWLLLRGLTPQPIPTALNPICLQNKNLCLSYPNDWKLNSYSPNSFDPLLAELIAPTQNNFRNGMPKIVVEQYPSDPTLTLAQFTKEAQQTIEQQLNQSRILQSEEIILDNYPGYRLVYTSQENQSDVKRLQLGILKQDTIYLVTYEATLNEYSTFEPVAKQIMNSLSLSP